MRRIGSIASPHVIQPFSRTPVGNTTRTRSAFEDAARYYYNQRQRLGAEAPMLRRRIRRSIDVLLVIPDITLAKSLIVQGWARPQVSRVTFELLRFEW